MEEKKWKICTHIGSGALVVLSVLLCIYTGQVTSNSYLEQRSKIIKDEEKLSLGGELSLSAEEKIVNDIIMKEKRRLIEFSRLNGTEFVPGQSFYISKPMMEKTTVLKIIKQMPKGAALHLHDLSSASLDWLVQNVTYRDHLYFCVDNTTFMIFKFFRNPPHNPDCPWKSVQKARAMAASVKDFDSLLKRNISFLAVDPVSEYKDDYQAWIRFNKYFEQVIDMIYYVPVFRDYVWQTLVEFRRDNVQYFEMRAQLFGLLDLDGNSHDAEFGLNVYKSAIQEFVKRYPDFSGAKIIMSGLRFKSKELILKEVQTAATLHSRYPSIFLGYDLVGEEPNQFSLLHYLDELLYPSRQNPPYYLPYFFHAGETSWQGTAADYNLVDAILLNTTRIGHGYALSKHPSLVKLVREKQIAVEVNPISNQLLGLVKDVRNHPMVGLMADDFPIVISSDDPATWEALPLSHDFYVTFMAMSGEDADLSFLKQLILNSFKYSVMKPAERKRAMDLWKDKWSEFINNVAHMKF
ncbi:adenosine deaminase AGSA-like [Aplysia californica]|uniref:adenosine deaminase n=1 Tax=Aplysia californica TaxID=6500 RepID=A0ABM0K2U0_APLCA|nr:adenosine deaminase AGSA-like [Aplysia californica]